MGAGGQRTNNTIVGISVPLQSQCMLLAVQGRGKWLENLIPCLLCISEAVQSQCILLAIQGGGNW